MTVLAGRKLKADNIANISLVAPIFDTHSMDTRLPTNDSTTSSKDSPPMLIFCKGDNSSNVSNLEKTMDLWKMMWYRYWLRSYLSLSRV